MTEGGGETKASGGAPAVFVNYASQDGAAAERICASLRAVGIEVWLDQSELRGGDARDRAIRDQIKGRALFIPVISAIAHARVEALRAVPHQDGASGVTHLGCTTRVQSADG